MCRPDINNWHDLTTACDGSATLVGDSVLTNLAKDAVVGARWVKQKGKHKVLPIKKDRPLEEQFEKQFRCLHMSIQMHIEKIRDKLMRSTQEAIVPEEGEVSITHVIIEANIITSFYQVDLGLAEECGTLIDKHKKKVKAFLIHLGANDKVDKAQFATCLGVVKMLGTADCYVVQVTNLMYHNCILLITFTGVLPGCFVLRCGAPCDGEGVRGWGFQGCRNVLVDARAPCRLLFFFV